METVKTMDNLSNLKSWKIAKTMDHLNNLKTWKVDKRVLDKIQDTGFDRLLNLTLPARHNLSLISALIDSYNDLERCFVFNNHRLLFSLEDVLYITGLPVDGKPVTGIDSEPGMLCAHFLGTNGCKGKTGEVQFEWLKSNFELVPEGIDENSTELEPYVRAYLLYLIGSVVFPDKAGGSVSVLYLPLLGNLQEVRNYAWGAAMLAHLHISLAKAKKERSSSVRGNTYSLMVFAMEHVPKLASPIFPDTPLVYPMKFPLMEGWTELLCRRSKFETETFLEIINSLDEEDIVWQPYKRLPEDFLPEYCAGQEKLGKCRTILICFEKASYHRPDLCPQQFGVEAVDTSALRPLVELKLESRSGPKGKDWRSHGGYGAYLEEWENRESCLIDALAELEGPTPLLVGGFSQGTLVAPMPGTQHSNGDAQHDQYMSPTCPQGTLVAFIPGPQHSNGDAQHEQYMSHECLQGALVAHVPNPQHSNGDAQDDQYISHTSLLKSFASSVDIDVITTTTTETKSPFPSADIPLSVSIDVTTTSTAETKGLLPSAEIPLSWPPNGILTLDWIQGLMSIFDWSSRNLAPSDFPSVLPVPVFNSLVLSASKILHKEANCVRVDDCEPHSSVVVIGDVHGQLHDVLFLLRDAGFPSEHRFFVFNGNYVDKGAWGLETLLLLLAWKVFMPQRVYLLRGSHETKYCTSLYGFEKEVMTKYGDKGNQLYQKCLRCFEGLPLASIIAGRVYTTHGGLFRSVTVTPSKRSRGKKNQLVKLNTEARSLSLGSLEELSRAKRSVLDPPWEGSNMIPGDVLWSDPSMRPGVSLNKERGIGLLWGPDCTEDFLKKCHLKLIIRSHEGPDAREKRSGLSRLDEGYTIDHVVESGKLITLFSSPDHPQFQTSEERNKNKGAYIVLDPPGFDIPKFHSFEAVTPRPMVNPYYDYEHVTDADAELDLASMEPPPKRAVFSKKTDSLHR